MSTPFLRERDPEIVRTCSMCPCRAFDTLIFFIFLAGYVCSLNTQISPTIKKIPNIWRNITKKCICHLLGRGKINMCANFSGTIHQNRRGYWTLKDFGVICVNQPVPTLYCWGRRLNTADFASFERTLLFTLDIACF